MDKNSIDEMSQEIIDDTKESGKNAPKYNNLMYCTYCSAAVHSYARFCHNCGRHIWIPQAPVKREKSISSLFLGLSAYLLLLAGLLADFFRGRDQFFWISYAFGAIISVIGIIVQKKKKRSSGPFLVFLLFPTVFVLIALIPFIADLVFAIGIVIFTAIVNPDYDPT